MWNILTFSSVKVLWLGILPLLSIALRCTLLASTNTYEVEESRGGELYEGPRHLGSTSKTSERAQSQREHILIISHPPSSSSFILDGHVSRTWEMKVCIKFKYTIGMWNWNRYGRDMVVCFLLLSICNKCEKRKKYLRFIFVYGLKHKWNKIN